MLADAVAEIDDYLADERDYDYCDKIIRVRNEMDALRLLLDTPPSRREALV